MSDHPPEEASAARYRRGCRCAHCREVNRLYVRAWRDRRRGGPSGFRYWTDEEALDALRGWAEANGRTPVYRDWEPAPEGCPGSSCLVEKFGSWANALVVAGLEGRPPGDSIRDRDAYDAETAAIAARFDAGETLAAIGREIGCTGQSLGRRVRAWREVYGVQGREHTAGRVASR